MNTQPSPGEKLTDLDFETVVCLTPLVSIDIVVRLENGLILLGHRKYEPAKGAFFLPGGRVTKNERLEAAFRRITLSEIGVQKELKDARFLGRYDHIYDTNRFEKPGFGTHYVAFGYEVTLSQLPNLPPDQHDAYVWRTEAELLAAPDVHEYTKAYLRPVRLRSECQYSVVAARRNTHNTMLWQTPALSLTALAFLLNVAGNRGAYLEVRLVTCLLALFVALFTLQLFVRHRKLERRDSDLLEEFEIRNPHLGYAVIHTAFPTPTSRRARANPFNWRSYRVWITLFSLFAIASAILFYLNLSNGWQDSAPTTTGSATNSPSGRSANLPKDLHQINPIAQISNSEPASVLVPPVSPQASAPKRPQATNPPPASTATAVPGNTNAPGANK